MWLPLVLWRGGGRGQGLEEAEQESRLAPVGWPGTLAMKEKAGVELWAALRPTTLVGWSNPRLGLVRQFLPDHRLAWRVPCCVVATRGSVCA